MPEFHECLELIQKKKEKGKRVKKIIAKKGVLKKNVMTVIQRKKKSLFVFRGNKSRKQVV